MRGRDFKLGMLRIRRCMGAVFLVICMLVTGCSGGVQANAAAQDEFDTYLDEMFLEEVALNTINLHYTLAYPKEYGITDYEVTLGDFSYDKSGDNNKSLAVLERELRRFDESQLTTEQQITYDILMDYVRTEKSVSDLALYMEVLSPTTGYQAQLPVILAEYTFRTRQDIEDYLALVALIDDIFVDMVAFEEEKAEAGLFMADYAAEAVIEQCEEFIADPENNYMIEVFNDKIDAFEGLSDEEREAYKEQHRTLITTEVVDGYQTLIDGLTNLLGSGTNELGLCYYEDGQRYYEYLVNCATGSDDSIQQLEQRTEDCIEECMLNMWDVMEENPEIYAQLYDYEFPESEPESIIEDLKERVSEDFPELPEVDYTIKYVHPSMQEHLSPAFYLTTPIDDSSTQLIYINEKYLEEGSGMDLYPTMAHEGYPGHMYQTVYTNESGLPLVRNLFSYSGYTEGWATYVEFYSYSVSGLDEDLANVLVWDEIATLGLYAYIDLNVHYDGWDRENTAEYLSMFGINDEEVVDDVFEIIVEEPANYLSYFIGYLEFIELREMAEEELGNDFVAKDFHQFLMETGPAPFYIIEDYMEDWMKEQ